MQRGVQCDTRTAAGRDVGHHQRVGCRPAGSTTTSLLSQTPSLVSQSCEYNLSSISPTSIAVGHERAPASGGAPAPADRATMATVQRECGRATSSALLAVDANVSNVSVNARLSGALSPGAAHFPASVNACASATSGILGLSWSGAQRSRDMLRCDDFKERFVHSTAASGSLQHQASPGHQFKSRQRTPRTFGPGQAMTRTVFRLLLAVLVGVAALSSTTLLLSSRLSARGVRTSELLWPHLGTDARVARALAPLSVPVRPTPVAAPGGDLSGRPGPVVPASNDGDDGTLPAPLLPVVPAFAVLRYEPRSLPRFNASDAQLPASLHPYDVLVTDSFLVGHCVYAILAQWHNHTGYVDPRRLSIAIVTFNQRSLAPSIVSLKQLQVWATPLWNTQASATVAACDAALLADLDSVEVVFAFPRRAPAISTAWRVSAMPPLTISAHTRHTAVASPHATEPYHSVICTLVKGVRPAHLILWMRYHQLLGFEHAYIYVNEPWHSFVATDVDGKLRRWVADGFATFIAWAYPYLHPAQAALGGPMSHLSQTTAFNSCHRRFRHRAKHFAFLDVDEFMLSPTRPIRELLNDAKWCLLMGCTWGTSTTLLEPNVAGLLGTNITTVGALMPLKGDPHALYRHKLYARADAIEIVGPHGMLDIVDSNGVRRKPKGCPFVWKPAGTDTAEHPHVAAFLHLLTPALEAARAPAAAREYEGLAQELLQHPSAHHTDSLNRSLMAAGTLANAFADSPASDGFALSLFQLCSVRGLPRSDARRRWHGTKNRSDAPDFEVVSCFMVGDRVVILLLGAHAQSSFNASSISLGAKITSLAWTDRYDDPIIINRAAECDVSARDEPEPATVDVTLTRTFSHADRSAYPSGGMRSAYTLQLSHTRLRLLQDASVELKLQVECQQGRSRWPRDGGSRAIKHALAVSISVGRQHHPARRYEVVMCSTIHGDLPGHFMAWLQYHQSLGVQRTYVYVAGGWDGNAPWRRPRFSELYQHQQSGAVRFVKWPSGGQGRDPFVATELAAADCRARLQHSATAILVVDVDSFVYVREGLNLVQAAEAAAATASGRCNCIAIHECWRLPLNAETARMPLEAIAMIPLQPLAGANANSSGPRRRHVHSAPDSASEPAEQSSCPTSRRVGAVVFLNDKASDMPRPLVGPAHASAASARMSAVDGSGTTAAPATCVAVTCPGTTACVDSATRNLTAGRSAQQAMDVLGVVRVVGPNTNPQTFKRTGGATDDGSGTPMYSTITGSTTSSIKQHVGGNLYAGSVLASSLANPRGHCKRCVAEAPLSPEQINEALADEQRIAIEPDAQLSRTFFDQRAAYYRCEALPACPTGTESSVDDAVVSPYELPVGGEAAMTAVRELSHGPLSPYPGMPKPLPLPVPPGTRILVQGENSRGRYSNMRHALLDMVQLGLLTNRTVVLAPMGHSITQCRERMEDLYDWPHLNTVVHVVASPPLVTGLARPRLVQHCAYDTTASVGGIAPYMLQNVERHVKYTPRSTPSVPTWGQWKVAGGVPWHVVPYGSRQRLIPMLHARHADTCVGLSAAFWALPGPHRDATRLQNALRPSGFIQRRIDEFLSTTLRGQPFVSVHLRLTDLGFANSTYCHRDMRRTIEVVRKMSKDRHIELVALATDDFSSACSQQFMAAFEDTVAVLSHTFAADSCAEAQFVQEVLARGTCFVGSLNSTMSYAIQSIRTTSRVRESDLQYPERCEKLLPAGQLRSQW